MTGPPVTPGLARALADARRMDETDPLRAMRFEFHIPQQANGEDEIYLCGNSLGLQPRRTAAYVTEELEKWQRLAVKGHFASPRPWMPYHEFLAEQTAALVGAAPDEVVTMNSLTVNLHLMMVSFYRPAAGRHKILIEEHAFPSDRYAVCSQLRFHGFDPRQSLVLLKPGRGRACFDTGDIAEVIEREGDQIALILLPGVQYYSGQLLDMEMITRLGHAHGCLVGFDLAHAAGNVPLRLHDWGCDFACWCTYKYLNSGPGSVAGCFVHARHRQSGRPRFAGWWGHDKATRFQMGPEFHPIPGAEGWQLSNPPILSLAAIRASLDVFQQAGGMMPLRAKSKRLTGFLEHLLRSELNESVAIVTPADPEQRGCQLSLKLRSASGDGKRVFDCLTANGIICDWRAPDVIRVTPVPLYNRFEDVYLFAKTLQECLQG